MKPIGALKVSGVSSGYGGAIVVRDVTLEIEAGEIFALLGKNGMGKTTLLKTVLGFLPARSGRVDVFGEDVTRLPSYIIARRGIAYSPQEQTLFQDLTVEENLRLGLRDDRRVAAETDRVAEYFPILRERRRQKAGTLSGGEQKMLIVARALMASARLILIDEISEGLQPSMIDRLANVLRAERRRTGATILMVEQNVPFALSVADRYAVLKIGEIADAGRADASDAVRQIKDHLSV
jgi:ABC-type branched-subunit amino acid transport system ATPase component